MPSTIGALVLLVIATVAADQTYIVHMNPHAKPSSFQTHLDWYAASLHSTNSILYSYDVVYNGFAASLTPTQANTLRQSDAVLGVYKDQIYHLHTTRTPQFLGLDSQPEFQPELNIAAHDVIIGVLDTGVWPESASFDDVGMPEIPSRWRGECESGADFNLSLCNRKLIGARSFSKGFRMANSGKLKKNVTRIESSRDTDGHGTHTASTAAGSAVTNASLLGYASGTARGMAISARVASYKVCWSNSGCFGSDILAAMDRAILDGVDVLSLSLGGGSGPYYRDSIAIGAFAAMEKGIFVSCSAGNSGPSKGSLANVAPWIMTVGAGTLDRDFPAFVILGANKNEKKYVGVSLYSGNGMGDTAVGLVYFKDNSSSNLCLAGSLNPDKVRGKVVLCDRGVNHRVEKGQVVRDAGGIGMILANTATSGEELIADSHFLPALTVGKKVGDIIRLYVKTDVNPTALLSFGGTVLNVKPSPIVAAFSSRGPNTVTPQILKPDLIGPGVNILASWPEGIGPSGMVKDYRKTKFNILSGTFTFLYSLVLYSCYLMSSIFQFSDFSLL